MSEGQEAGLSATKLRAYIGIKQVMAEPGRRQTVREPSGEAGYRVLYPDGYESWSPKHVFEEAYRLTTNMDFAGALFFLKAGKRVAREGWNGKGMWIVLIHPGNAMYTVGGCGLPMQPCIGMKTAQSNMQPGWLASQADLLAEDWRVLL
jgi:hypothetical protein